MAIRDALTQQARQRALKLAGEKQPSKPSPAASLIKIPESAWKWPFDEWRGIVGPHSDAPDEYHWATMRVLLSLLAGRKLYTMHPRRIYANCFMLLIGPARRNRKSTCLGYGLDLIQIGGFDYLIIRHPESPKRIYDMIAKNPGKPTLIFQDEFRGLLAASHRPGTADMLARLNTLYYCPDQDTVGGEKAIEIKDSFLSLMTGAPLAWLEDTFHAGDITGGFMGRFMVIAGERKKYIPRPRGIEKAKMERLADKLKKLVGALPPTGLCMEWAAAAANIWDPWASRLDRELSAAPENTTALIGGIEEQALKNAMIYSFTEKQTQLTESAVATSIQIADVLKHNALHSLGQIHLTRTAKLEHRILKFAQDHNPFTFTDLTNNLGSFWSREEAARSLDLLTKQGDLEDDPGAPPKGKRGHRWRLPPIV